MSTATSTYEQVSTTLDSLWDRDAFSKVLAEQKAIADPKVIATFGNEEGTLCFAMECELAVANSIGAALTMIPAGGAEDATAEGEVPSNIADNLGEVFNICSSSFAKLEHGRIVFKQTWLPGQELDDDTKSFLDSAKTFVQFNYEIDGYQAGVVSISQLGE